MNPLVQFLNDLAIHGDAAIGLPGGPLLETSPDRWRITRRGNVQHDGVTVFQTWGMGSIKERCAIAQRYIDEHRDQ